MVATRLWVDIYTAGLFTVLSGYLCVIAQLVLYVWITETKSIRIVALVLGGVSVLPLLDFLLPFNRGPDPAAADSQETVRSTEHETSGEAAMSRGMRQIASV